MAATASERHCCEQCHSELSWDAIVRVAVSQRARAHPTWDLPEHRWQKRCIHQKAVHADILEGVRLVHLANWGLSGRTLWSIHQVDSRILGGPGKTEARDKRRTGIAARALASVDKSPSDGKVDAALLSISWSILCRNEFDCEFNRSGFRLIQSWNIWPHAQ